jgi:hypothetical protein
MQIPSARLALTAGALFTILALPTAAQAQASLLPIKVTEKQSRAQELDRKAAEYEINDWSKIRTAAKLREQAAGLREDADVMKSASLYWAARDRYYSDDVSTARTLMVSSAEHALAIGDVIAAANAFTDAAYLSTDLRDVESTRTYATRARLLASSPMLSAEQRSDVLSRLAFGGLTAERVASLGVRR